MTEAVLKISKSNKLSTLEKNCPYGLLYFCDGSVNRAEMKEHMLTKKGPCEYLKNGKCTHRFCRIN